MNDRNAVIVTGAAGSFGRVAVRALALRGHEVHAVDQSEHASWPAQTEFHPLDVRKKSFDELVRSIAPRAILHLALVRNFELTAEQRHRINFEGTARVFEIGRAHRVPKMGFVSRATVYGAFPEQSQFVDEEHPPAAGRTFPEIQDLIAADLYINAMIWRFPEVETFLLRPVNVLGPTVQTLMNRYLSSPRVFTVLGFNPIQQILHESDLGAAFNLALRAGVRGAYNVTGPGELPLHVLIEEAGARSIPLPEAAIVRLKGRMGFPEVPAGAIEYLKYPCTVDGTKFRSVTGFKPEVGLRSTVRSVPWTVGSATRGDPARN